MKATGLFREVITGSDVQPAAGDLMLTAALAEFDGFRGRDEAKEAIASNPFLGLTSLMVSTLAKARYRGRTRLANVRLVETESGRVVWEGDVAGAIDGEERLVNGYWTVYEHANASLKDAVDQLVRHLAEGNAAASQ